MQLTRVLNATRRTIQNQPKILPPLKLYKRILRSHMKYLPSDCRQLGDQYVKSEFKLHQKIDNPVQIIGFLSSWQKYCEQLEGDQWRGAKIDPKQLASMTDEQLVQLYELMLASRDEPSKYQINDV